MEYEKCGSLLNEIRNYREISKKHSNEQFFRMIQDITSGLCYLLSEGLMHRDIKPHNILISEEGRMKLCDFESLKEIDQSTHTIAVGHRGYMAPEFDLKNGKYSEKIDIWSLGMTLLQTYFHLSIREIEGKRLKFLEDLESLNKDLYLVCEQCLKVYSKDRISALKLNEYVNIQLKDFFEMKDLQYGFLTTSKGEIVSSKYINNSYKNIEKEIEVEIQKILSCDVKVRFIKLKFNDLAKLFIF